MIDKTNVNDIGEEELMAFLNKWLAKDKECMAEAFAIEKSVTTFEMTVISFVRAGLLVIPCDINAFGDN